jgi:uncharacterized protein DUF4199
MEKKQTHIMYGFVSGILMAVISLVLYLTGLSFKPGMEGIQYVAYLPFLVGIILNATAYSKANDGFVTFGNVFGSCFKAAMLVTLVVLAWSVISMMVFPDMKEKALALARDKMAASSRNMTDEQMDAALNITKKYFSTFMIAGVLLGMLFYGAIFSLIGAAIAKKKGPAPITSSNF